MKTNYLSPNNKEYIKIGLLVIIMLVIPLVLCLVIDQHINQDKIEQERIKQERLVQEEEYRRRAEEEHRKREREISQRIGNLCANPWKRIVGDPYGKCKVVYVKFSKGGEVYLGEKKYAGGNLIDKNGDWYNYRINGNRVYIGGVHRFDFDGTSLVSTEGTLYRKGDSLFRDYY